MYGSHGGGGYGRMGSAYGSASSADCDSLQAQAARAAAEGRPADASRYQSEYRAACMVLPAGDAGGLGGRAANEAGLSSSLSQTNRPAGQGQNGAPSGVGGSASGGGGFYVDPALLGGGPTSSSWSPTIGLLGAAVVGGALWLAYRYG